MVVKSVLKGFVELLNGDVWWFLGESCCQPTEGPPSLGMF